MANATVSGLVASWEDLRANPVFKRTLLPRGFRSIIRSPIVRSVVFTAIALSVYESILKLPTGLIPLLGFVILFWTIIMAIQRFFCWFEFSSLAATGTLDDYLNSGLSRADVALGIIYPAVLAEYLAVGGIIAYWAISNHTDAIMLGFYALIAYLILRRLWDSPFVFLPDVESYLRKRNPLTLYFVGLAVLVPQTIWFTMFFGIFFGTDIAFGLFGVPMPVRKYTVIFAFAITYFLSTWPMRWWQMWRIRRFYSRYHSFDELFDTYIENREIEAARRRMG
ncbi:hypothetical protein KQI84_09115 [bacterium]|nr:hypothetical protein [bacterium]